jgi:1-deoxy-D-xylulose-5-phosphate reductoisomerase
VKKRVAILGSTGSIGKLVLKVIESFPNQFKIIALTTNKNIKLLKEQIIKYCPLKVSVGEENLARRLRQELKEEKTKVVSGREGLQEIASLKNIDLVVSALSGGIGLVPTLTAIKNNKPVALANKETLVMAGKLVMEEVHRHRSKILPIDSEHSALFQCLQKETLKNVKKIILTASGGPFLNTKLSDLPSVTPRQALTHPSWKRMGKKVTLDAATLLNKGFEVIEAHWLFNIPFEKIEVLIHPQSIVHGLIEFVDGSLLAQLSRPRMLIPIQYALCYPERHSSPLTPLNLIKESPLTFAKPDLKKFPCLKYAYEVGKRGGTLPSVLVGSSEIAAEAFLKRKINFLEISEVIYQTLKAHSPAIEPTVEEIVRAFNWSKEKAQEEVEKIRK